MEPIDAIYEDGVIKPLKPLSLPEHTPIRVEVTPADSASVAPGEGLQRSAGAWADDAAGLDQYLQQVSESR